jgi:hypothetical protein
MSNVEEGRIELKIGSRVHVMSADGKKDLGLGRYMGIAPMKDVLDDPTPLSVPVSEPIEMSEEDRAQLGAVIEELTRDGATTPKIALDNGDTVYGFQCWWTVVNEDCDQTESEIRVINTALVN